MRASPASRPTRRTPEGTRGPTRLWLAPGVIAKLLAAASALAQPEPGAPGAPAAPPSASGESAAPGAPAEPVAVAAGEAGSEPVPAGEATAAPGEATAAGAMHGAATAPSSGGGQPVLFHVPPSTATAGEPLEIAATLTESWQLRSVSLVYRRLDRGDWHGVPFRRVSTGDFTAVVPAEEVAAPAIEYYIESVDREGRTRRHFASADRPHRVEVVGMTAAQEEQAEEERFGGARHRFAARSDWSSFGDRSVAGWVPQARREDHTDEELRPRTDDWVEFHADYTYRLLGIVESIHFGFGIVRGHAPRLDYEADLDERSEDERAPGFNYGWSAIAFRFHRYFGMGVDVFLGATQYGFDGGGGGFLRVGHTAETHFDLGVDYISNLGYRAWATFEWDTVPYVPMSLTAEFTDCPDPGDDDGDGIRLWYGAAAHVWKGLILSARVGYAARHGSNTGGPIVGGGVAYEF